MAVGGQEIGRGALCNITPPQLHITCVQGALVGRCFATFAASRPGKTQPAVVRLDKSTVHRQTATAPP